MIVDLQNDARMPDWPADICIVGAGAAGIVLAAKMARRGKRVLLLESGGATAEPSAQDLNECAYVGQSRRAASRGRFRALGGTTTVWGGQILELCPEDFAARSWIPGSGWPISRAELQPYYDQALQVEGLANACRQDEAVWRLLGIDPPDLGPDFQSYFTRWCPEPNFARLYRESLAAPNLRVVLHATATELLLDQGGSRIGGVRCRTLTGREQIFSSAVYVLCLGTIESVRFLLQPIAGRQPTPWSRSGLLGCHFQSHIDWNAARVPAKSAATLRKWFANAYLRGYKYHPKFRLASEAQEQLRTLGIAGSITCIDGAEAEQRRVKAMVRNALHGRPSGFEMRDLPRVLRQLRAMLRLGYGYLLQHRAYWPAESEFWLRVHCEQEPLTASRIRLTEARDATGLLGAEVDWKVSDWEWRTIQCFTRQVEQALRNHGLAEIVPQPELLQPDGYRGVVFDNSHHDMGGTRMARSPREGVVDTDLKLHEIANAYVCSASVFPSSGFSNPTHTLIALALRLADHLEARVSSQPLLAATRSRGGEAAHA